MKTQFTKQWILLLVISLALAACSLNTVPEAAAGYPVPQVWFDAPLPGTAYPLGEEIQVVAHAADKAGVSEIEFSLESGQMIGSQSGSQSESLLTASFLWHPPEPGVYILQVRAMNVNGDWSPYTYTDVVVVEGEEDLAPTPEEPTQVPIEEPTPTPTTAAPVVTDTLEPCTDLARFVDETIPDSTVFKPGASFTKTWTLRNNGTCTWTTRYALRFYDGDQMSGPNQVQLPKQVLPGEDITLSVNLTAPAQNGTYRGRWMLMNDQGVLFALGDQGNVPFWVEIVVQREDAQAPTVEVSYEPNGRGEPTGRQKITLTAEASDNVKVVKIEIYLTKGNEQAQLLNTCVNTNSCSYQIGPLNPADYHLQAFAYDAAGNKGSSAKVDFKVVP